MTIEGDWVFTVPSFRFDIIEMVTDTFDKVEISLGLEGIGLPEAQYLFVTKHLYGLN